MNELEILEKLSSAAEREEVPRVDVSRKVIISVNTREDDLDRPLAWIAGLSFAASLPAAVIAFNVLANWVDPLQDIFSTFRWVML